MPNTAAVEADRADFETYIAAELRGRSGTERTEAEAFLRANPGMSVRDWKGKGFPMSLGEPDQEDWSDLDPDQVREAATRQPARLLARNVRQAAGRDPSLVWNPLARRYRRRVAGEERCGGLGQGGDTGPNGSAPYGTAERRETDARAPTSG
jgi:hypothetical protein